MESIPNVLANTLPENRDLILKFKSRLLADNISSGRILKYIYTLRELSAMLNKSFVQSTKDDMIELVGKINASSYAQNTKCDFKKILKRFYKWINGDEISPETTRWIKTGRDKEQTLKPEEILTPDEIKAIANNMSNQMLKSLVLTLFASGARIGEILPAKIKQFAFDDKGIIFNIVEGKTGARRVRIDAPFYNYYINELLVWLQSHPDKNNPEAYIWQGYKGNFVVYKTVRENLFLAAKKAGITKPINPHAFRHASATFDSSLPAEVKKAKYGWKTMDMINVYTSLSGKQIDEEILRFRGVDINDKDEMGRIISKPCKKCGHNNQLSEHLCTKCNYPLDYEGSVKVDEIDRVKTEAVYRFIKRQVDKDPENEKDWLDILDELKIRDVWDKQV